MRLAAAALCLKHSNVVHFEAILMIHKAARGKTAESSACGHCLLPRRSSHSVVMTVDCLASASVSANHPLIVERNWFMP